MAFASVVGVLVCNHPWYCSHPSVLAAAISREPKSPQMWKTIILLVSSGLKHVGKPAKWFYYPEIGNSDDVNCIIIYIYILIIHNHI